MFGETRLANNSCQRRSLYNNHLLGAVHTVARHGTMQLLSVDRLRASPSARRAQGELLMRHVKQVLQNPYKVGTGASGTCSEVKVNNINTFYLNAKQVITFFLTSTFYQTIIDYDKSF